MVQIQNSEAIDAIKRGAGLTISEGLPQNLLPNVQPVLDMTPRFHRNTICQVSNTTASGTATILTAQASKRYLIHGYQASFVKDAACDTANGSVQVNFTQGAIVKGLFAFPVLTLTAERDSSTAMFVSPILCDENTAITFSNQTFTAGNLRRSVVIYYSEIT